MSISHRKSTSPRRRSAHAPIRPAFKSTSQPWCWIGLISESGTLGAYVLTIDRLFYPNDPSQSPVQSADGYLYNPNGNGIYCVAADGTRFEPTSVALQTGDLGLDITFDFTEFPETDVALIVEPDQTILSAGQGVRLAAHGRYFETPI